MVVDIASLAVHVSNVRPRAMRVNRPWPSASVFAEATPRQAATDHATRRSSSMYVSTRRVGEHNAKLRQ